MQREEEGAACRSRRELGGADGLGTPFVTALVTLADAPVRLLGVVEGDEIALRIGAKATGRVGRTPFGEAAIPAIRWSLDA